MPLKLSEHKSAMTNKPTIAVFGLGFVGLPLALSFAMKGCEVMGIDVLEPLVNELSNGLTHHKESHKGVSIADILKVELSEGRFRPTTDAAGALREAAAIIVTVGIPVAGGKANLEPLKAVCRTIAAGLKPGDTVIIRSTVVPGTTEEVVQPILEESGLHAGVDFYLAYASERIAEGRAFEEFENLPCLVAGINPESTEQAAAVLSHVTKAPLIFGSNIKAVEITKVLENVQRDVNIAMVQEFARLTERLGIDIFEVVRLANTHPRVRLLEPGPGVGGYCVPNALYYLLPKAVETGLEMPLANMARRINDDVPRFVVALVEEALAPKSLKGAGTIGVVGLAMKDFSNDDRLSPAVYIVNLLLQKGYAVRAYDPAVPTAYPFKVGSLEECCSEADCVLILARQHGLTPEAVSAAVAGAGPGCVVVDTRNLLPSGLTMAGSGRIIRI